MQPWMILAALMGLGVATLLVAPTLHRRSIAKAQGEADSQKRKKADALRTDPSSESHEMESPGEAKRIRDGLILRGIKSAITSEGQKPILVVRNEDSDDVRELIERYRSGT